MANYLPPAIMAFFQPRPKLEYAPPMDKRPPLPYCGIGHLMHRMKEYAETIPLPVIKPTPAQIKDARKQKLKAKAEQKLQRHKAKWKPKEREGLTSDAFKTLFVARLSYDVSADDLKHEFEFYGPVSKVFLIKDRKGKSRGYGYVEFQSSKDLKEAYNDADGRKIAGRRIVVDVERGRTVKNWLPRRLGGGLGGTRIGGKDENTRYSGRNPPASSSSSSASTRRDSDRSSRREEPSRDSSRSSRGSEKERRRSPERDDKKRSRRDRSRSRSRDRSPKKSRR